MEEKINVAEILKDKPQGTKLYDLLYNIDVELDTISTTDTETVVWCINETDNNTTCHRGYSEFATVRGCSDGLRILLPSKEMRNWSKFAWKKGDVLVTEGGAAHIIFEKFTDDTYTIFAGKYYYCKNGKKGYAYLRECDNAITEEFTLETEDAAKTFIGFIEKRLGGKMNRETLEIEKTQPEFKDGDIAFADYGNRQYVFIVSGKTDLLEGYNSFISLDLSSLTLSMGYITNFFKKDLCKLRLATEEEKKQLFSALEKNGKAWDAKKKMIVDLKPKYEFKPMDLCLMKYIGQYNNRGWELCQYAYTEHRVSSSGEQREFYHSVGGEIYAECIPYNEDTKHLLGTKTEWKGGEQ
nr:MAG TPA: hypothetical protein [Caudoviricetes sp.]